MKYKHVSEVSSKRNKSDEAVGAATKATATTTFTGRNIQRKYDQILELVVCLWSLK